MSCRPLALTFAALTVIAGCKAQPHRYCYPNLVEQDGGYAYQMDGGYFYEPDGGYIYEPDGGYWYEPDGGYWYEADGAFIYEPDGKSFALICRGGIRCNEVIEDPDNPGTMKEVDRCEP